MNDADRQALVRELVDHVQHPIRLYVVRALGHAKIGECVERQVAAEDQLKRIDIRARQASAVHQSTADAVGAMINPGEAIILIVTEAVILTVEARVAHHDVSQLLLGQTAMYGSGVQRCLKVNDFQYYNDIECSGQITPYERHLAIARVSGNVGLEKTKMKDYVVCSTQAWPSRGLPLGLAAVILKGTTASNNFANFDNADDFWPSLSATFANHNLRHQRATRGDT